MEKNRSVVMAVLVLLVVVLGLLVLYAFVLKPAVSGYVVNAQNQGINYAIAAIVSQIQQNGYAQVPVGNQTLILVPYQPSVNSVKKQNTSA